MGRHVTGADDAFLFQRGQGAAPSSLLPCCPGTIAYNASLSACVHFKCLIVGHVFRYGTMIFIGDP